jgi:hypothetical protein
VSDRTDEAKTEASKPQEPKPYAPPALRVYGPIGRVTQGTGGTLGDGFLGMTRM